jgi:hypothetical protein
MRPDDILRGLESSLPPLAAIRKACDFVGYDNIRRTGSGSGLVSMSALLRSWYGARYDTPSPNSSGLSAQGMAEALEQRSTHDLIEFLKVAYAAWARDPEYFRLWGNLNLTICMWLWNKLVIDRDRSGSRRYVVLSSSEFKECLMSVSANGDYLSWLPGRNLTDRDRSPCYVRLKGIFVRRLTAQNKGGKVLLPQPAWASG